MESLRSFVYKAATGLLETAFGLAALVAITLAAVWLLNQIAPKVGP